MIKPVGHLDKRVFLSFNLKIDCILRVCHMIKKLNLHLVYVLSFFKNFLLSASFFLISDVNNKSLTNKRSKQAVHQIINTLVTIFMVSTRKCYCSICKEFAWVALVGIVAL